MSQFPAELVDTDWYVLDDDAAPEAAEAYDELDMPDEDGAYSDPGDDLESPVHSGQHGELWLGDGDYTIVDGTAMRKPIPNGTAIVCVVCKWPLPIRWSWSACESGGPTAWRSRYPAMEAVLDADPLLYRVMPWLWTFCRCNGCLDRARGKGRPPKYCSRRCEAEADNARDRAKRLASAAVPRRRRAMTRPQQYVMKITAQSS